MEELLEQVHELCKKIKEYVLFRIDDFVYIKHDKYVVEYRFKDYRIAIWIGNGPESAAFYEEFASMRLDYCEYTSFERAVLWSKAQEDIKKHSENIDLKNNFITKN